MISGTLYVDRAKECIEQVKEAYREYGIQRQVLIGTYDFMQLYWDGARGFMGNDLKHSQPGEFGDFLSRNQAELNIRSTGLKVATLDVNGKKVTTHKIWELL